MKTLVCFLALLMVTPLWGQNVGLIEQPYGEIILDRVYDPHSPIVASVQVESGPTKKVRISWSASSENVQYREAPMVDPETKRITGVTTLYIWAPPGNHWLEAVVQVLTVKEVTIEGEKVEILLDSELRRFSKTFSVRGTPIPPGPDPGPGPGPDPGPTPFPTPSAELQILVQPIKNVMIATAVDAAKANIFSEAWKDFHKAVVANPFNTVGEFKGGMRAFMNAVVIEKKLQGAFPGFSEALATVGSSYLGTSDVAPLDAKRAADFVAAMAWACKR